MKLSKRLETIASLVPKNVRVIDVGCDHALLDIYLTLQKSNECIASDVNEQVLKKTKEMVSNYNLLEKIKIVKSDGIKDIDLKEDDAVVIAGMGTSTILHILEEKEPNHLIIQSNNDLEILREGLSNKGYQIANEQVVFEKDIYYVIIEFKKGQSSYSEMELLFGPALMGKNDEITIAYFKYLLEKKKKIVNQIPDDLKKRQLEKEITWLKEVTKAE